MTAPNVTCDGTPPGCEPGGTWISLAPHGLSKYEVWSKGGQGRDQRPVRNKATGNLLAVSEGTQRRNTNRRGYLQVKPYPDQGKKQDTRTVHSIILLGNVGPPPEGMQTRHLDNDQWNNRWEPGTEAETKAAGGNLIYGTGPEQRKDQVKAGTVTPPPTMFKCVNHDRCGAMVTSKGRRCPPCMREAGIRAAALLSDGTPLKTVTSKLHYKNEVHVHALARQYGGYRGSLAQARSQRRPSLYRRILGRFRRTPGSGDSQ